MGMPSALPWMQRKSPTSMTTRYVEIRLVEAKRKGKDVHRVEAPAEEEPAGLMEALRRSLEQSKRGRRRTRNGAAELTREELQERARDLGIEGRSKMSKAQLAKAVASAK